MKVVLTGADGMLGRDIVSVFSGTASKTDLTGLTLERLDITSLAAVMKTVRELKPDLLIHGAAYTDVDGAETDPEKAYLVNGVGTRNLAMASAELGCPIMYISTDYVFDGTKIGQYNEWDRTSPVNQYGLSKLMGEQFISSLTQKYYIVRTSWLCGKNGKNFVGTISRLLDERESLDVVDDQRGCPTFAFDLALKLRELMEKGYGTYHITNSGNCSWYEFAKKIAEYKKSKTKINPVSSDKFASPARRPANSVLGNTMLRLEGIKPARLWEEALKEYLGV
ncbi:MAG: dTDP-4-dehydrorhamnose reductase [Thermodesulfovibrio sp.]|nr:dTDP-4-dehydrorhamnose reductase [Thermodesulfovibrio sp.]